MAKKKSFLSKITTFLFVILFLLILLIGGAVAAIYLQVVSDEQVQWANENLGLYKLPVVGADQMLEYFKVPDGVVWPEPEPEPEPTEEEKNKSQTDVAANNPSAKAAAEGDKQKSKDVKISRKEIEEQMAARETAEKKRISKLARIYENMKPEEAAQALDGVEMDTVVLILQKMTEDSAAQVLAKMEPIQAARLTQMLFEGTQRRLPTPTAGTTGQ